MKKLSIILLTLLVMLNLVACSNSKKDNDTISTTPQKIEEKIIEAIGKDNYLCDTEIDEDWLKNYFGLDLSKVESYVAKQNSISSVNLDTVVILKVKDGYADEAVKTLNKVFSQTVEYIRQYPFGTAKVLNGRIYQQGDYVIYIIAGANYDGEDLQEESKLAIEQYAKIDEALKEIFNKSLENLAIVPEENSSDNNTNQTSEDDLPLIGG